MLNKLLNILRQISETIAQNENHTKILADIVKTLAHNFEVDVCSVYIYHEHLDELILAATCGLNEESVGNVKLKPGKGITGASFKRREVMNISHPENHPDFVYFQGTGEERYKSFLAAPLTLGGNCFGVLTVQRQSAELFPDYMVDMVKSLSTQMANLLMNAKLLRCLADENANNSVESVQKEKEENQPDRPNGPLMLRGIAANPGIGRGKVFIFKSGDLFDEITHLNNTDKAKELAILENAIRLTKEKTLELEKKALSMISEADASIFHVHLLFLDDKSLIDEIRKEINVNTHTAEYSIKVVFEQYKQRFIRLKDQTFQDKVMDLKDVMLRLAETVKMLKDGTCPAEEQHTTAPLSERFIIASDELLPSALIKMPVDNIAGIICEKGGATAHIAILARALNIPALMGIKTLMDNVRNHDNIIMDCHAELIHVNPSDQIVQHFDEIIRAEAEEAGAVVDKAPAFTSDGQKLTLRANISLICETSMLEEYGAEGVGLYRTEFMFMIRDFLPPEEDQCRVFSRIIKEAGTHEVTIRVLDIGGDKPLPYISFPKEDNPALGFRGTRVLFSRPDILKPHLRAILRSGINGKLRILFPMVASYSEIAKIKEIIAGIKSELAQENLSYSKDHQTGIMLEIPSAVFELDKILKEVDFVSIGSNDLLQYSFGVDRGNEMVSDMFQPFHPGFLKLLKYIRSIFDNHPGKKLSICGEMAGNILAVPLLIGAGIYDMSMAPRRLPSIKPALKLFSTAECRELFNQAILLDTNDQVKDLVRAFLTKKEVKFKA